MQANVDRLQEGLAGLGIGRGFQVLAGAQDDVPDEWIRPFDEAGEDAADSGPVRWTQPFKTAARRQGVQQIPGIDGVKLDRGGCGQQQAAGARRDVPQEPQQMVGFGRIVLPARREVAPPGAMGLVEDHAFVIHMGQPVPDFGAGDDQPGGDDAEPARTLLDRFRTDARIFEPVFVPPVPAVPHRRGQVEQSLQLALPLSDQRLGGEDQDRLVAGQGHQLRRHAELNGLAEADLVGEDETRPVRAEVGVESQFDEMLLVLPEADFLAIDRRFDDGGGGVRCFTPVPEIGDDDALRQPLDVLHHGVGQFDGKGRIPQGVELFLNPADGVFGVVLPEQFVVQAPGSQGFVDAAEEGGPTAVRQGDDARLAVDQAEFLVGNDLDLELAAGEELVEAPEAGFGRFGKLFRRRRAPFRRMAACAAFLAISTSRGSSPELQTSRTGPATDSNSSPATSRMEDEKNPAMRS